MNERQAAQIVKDEWFKIFGREPSNLETIFMMGVARLETGYGRLGQHGKLAEKGMYNWANIEKAQSSFPNGECPNGWASGKDWAEQTGGTSPVCFQVFNSDNEAANALIRNLTKRHWPVLKAINDDGTAESVAHAMKIGFDGNVGTNGAYYTADESKYASLLKSNIIAIGNSLKQLGEPYIDINKAMNKGNSVLFYGSALLGLIGGIKAYNKYKSIK